jgi:hypothetical protein
MRTLATRSVNHSSCRAEAERRPPLFSLPRPLPSTCLFVQANILHGLPFPDGQFTSTHQRLLVAAIPALQWPRVIRELVCVTRPGGWIELVRC